MTDPAAGSNQLSGVDVDMETPITKLEKAVEEVLGSNADNNDKRCELILAFKRFLNNHTELAGFLDTCVAFCSSPGDKTKLRLQQLEALIKAELASLKEAVKKVATGTEDDEKAWLWLEKADESLDTHKQSLLKKTLDKAQTTVDDSAMQLQLKQLLQMLHSLGIGDQSERMQKIWTYYETGTKNMPRDLQVALRDKIAKSAALAKFNTKMQTGIAKALTPKAVIIFILEMMSPENEGCKVTNEVVVALWKILVHFTDEHDKLQEQEPKLQEQHDKVQELQATNARLQETNTQLSTAVEQSTAESEQLKQTQAEAESVTNAEIRQQKATIDAFETQNTSLTDQNNSLTKEVGSLTKEVASLTEEVASLTEEVGTLTTQNASLTTQNVSLNGAVSQSCSKLAALEARLHEKQDKNNSSVPGEELQHKLTEARQLINEAMQLSKPAPEKPIETTQPLKPGPEAMQLSKPGPEKPIETTQKEVSHPVKSRGFLYVHLPESQKRAREDHDGKDGKDGKDEADDGKNTSNGKRRKHAYLLKPKGNKK
jgi:hypothetical protein